jgi:hypothetical protein
MKRFLPSVVLKRLPDFPVDLVSVVGAIIGDGVRWQIKTGGRCTCKHFNVFTTSSFSFQTGDLPGLG